MKKLFLGLCLLSASIVMAETAPIFYESFDKCQNDEDLKGYTGGNDGEWGGDIAKAIVVYTDNAGWEDPGCNGADQCVKVGIDNKGGSITTPEIACNGDIKLTFRAAPWIANKEDSVIRIAVSSGELDMAVYTLNTKKWNDISVRIYDVVNSVKITFSSGNKNRFFLDEVKVFAADPDDAYLRVSPKGLIDFGLLASGYSQRSKELSIEANNITAAGISLQFTDDNNAFVLDQSKLTSTGGKLTISCKENMPEGLYSATLKVSATSAKDANEKLEKTVYVGFQVTGTALQGSGTKDNPYTVSDVLNLWEDGTLWGGEKYWVRGYVLGGVYRNSSNQFAGISKTDDLSLVLASFAEESDYNKILTVQLMKDNARDNLNVVSNPELIGKEVFVYGEMNQYLGVYGVRGVQTEEHYVRDPKTTDFIIADSPELDTNAPMFDMLGRQVDATYHGIVIQNGKKVLR